MPALAFFKGTCTRGIYDNMKTAVETVFVGRDRQYNRRFLWMCGHYLVEPVACTPGFGLGDSCGCLNRRRRNCRQGDNAFCSGRKMSSRGRRVG